VILWDEFATSIDLDPATRTDISDELANSVMWQTYSYDHPPNAPTLLSPSIDWEQSIVEGHPTYPVRARVLSSFALTWIKLTQRTTVDAQNSPICASYSLTCSREL